MTKDEELAMDLALEALTVLLDEWTPARQAQLKGMEAVTAIKQARSAPVQEPVAFFDWYDNAHWGNEDFKEGCHRSWNAAIKYITPQQRKPLTDEEIQQIFIANSVAVDNGNAYMVAGLRALNITRAIEAAHGIKGEA